MRKYFIFSLLCFVVTSLSAQTIFIKNISGKPVREYVVQIPTEDLSRLSLGEYTATYSTCVVPVEISTDLAGRQKAIFPVHFLQPGESGQITLHKGNAYEYPKRTYAEISHKIGGHFEGHTYIGENYSWVKPNYLRVPDNFKDHAYYIKYEGPGWESDRVAFRFYLDQRNGIDVFGKKTPGIVLPHVGVDGYDNYHNMAAWGMDNMKVANALGIGSIASWDGEKAVRVEKTDSVVSLIPADGKVRSQVLTTYYGWDASGTKCTLKSLISIDAGSRASHMELLADKELNNLATGIIKMKDIDLIIYHNKNSEWSYIATFGKQSLNNDMMGLAVFARTSQIREITEDKLNHLILLSTENGYAEYYFMPTWEEDWEPVKTKEDFMKCIDEVMVRLNNPVEVSIK